MLGAVIIIVITVCLLKLVIVLTYVEIIMFSKGRVSDIESSLTNHAKKQSLTPSTDVRNNIILNSDDLDLVSQKMVKFNPRLSQFLSMVFLSKNM